VRGALGTAGDRRGGCTFLVSAHRLSCRARA
jgi:hypothetical protein